MTTLVAGSAGFIGFHVARALLLCVPGTVSTLLHQVAAHFTRNGRGSAFKNPSNVPQAHPLGTANLDSGALFNAEFDV